MVMNDLLFIHLLWLVASSKCLKFIDSHLFEISSCWFTCNILKKGLFFSPEENFLFLKPKGNAAFSVLIFKDKPSPNTQWFQSMFKQLLQVKK